MSNWKEVLTTAAKAAASVVVDFDEEEHPPPGVVPAQPKSTAPTSGPQGRPSTETSQNGKVLGMLRGHVFAAGTPYEKFRAQYEVLGKFILDPRQRAQAALESASLQGADVVRDISDHKRRLQEEHAEFSQTLKEEQEQALSSSTQETEQLAQEIATKTNEKEELERRIQELTNEKEGKVAEAQKKQIVFQQREEEFTAALATLEKEFTTDAALLGSK